jgi:DNA transformation protein
MSTPIRQMRNLGPVMERRLREIGIETEDDLRALGSIATWRRLRFVFGRDVSVIALHAMEAALLDCDWRHLPPEVKARLDRERQA